MTHKNMNAKEAASNSKDAVYKWAFTGGVIGAVLGFISNPGVLTITGINLVNPPNPVYVAIVAAVIGAFTGMIIKNLYRLRIPQNKALEKNSYVTEAKIELHEEELELFKQRIQTGEVKIHKEILKEEKNIVVPVTREELVIEKRKAGEENADNAGSGNEIIRIPIKEEHIEVFKYPVVLEDVTIYEHQTQELQHIKETLKSEILSVKTTGDVNVIEKGIEKQND